MFIRIKEEIYSINTLWCVRKFHHLPENYNLMGGGRRELKNWNANSFRVVPRHQGVKEYSNHKLEVSRSIISKTVAR